MIDAAADIFAICYDIDDYKIAAIDC